MIATIKVTRYFISSEGHEMAIEPTYTVANIELVEGDSNAQKAVRNALNPDAVQSISLPPELGHWREMTDDEARDYLKRKEEEEEASRLTEQRRRWRGRTSAYDEDED